MKHLVERDWWESVETPVFSATCTPAKHFSARGLGDRGDTLWCGWTIETDGSRIDAKPYVAYLRAKYGAGVAAL